MSATIIRPTSSSRTDDSMIVPPGYKQTEVGVIPEEWKIAPLAQLSAFITKGTTPTTYGYTWEESGVLFLRSECVSAQGLDLAQSMYISPDAHAALRRSDVRDGDLLITITGNVGRVIRLKGIGSANINQHIARIRIVARGVDAGYVHFFLSQDKVRRTFETITTGQAYPQISLVQVREARVALPLLPEQRAIAEALSDVDGLLGALEALIAKKRAIKQAAMQQLLTGKIRLPGFSGEWMTVRAGDIGQFLGGSGFPVTCQGAASGQYPFFKVSDMNNEGNDTFMDQANNYISEAIRKQLGAVPFPANSIVFAKVGAAVFLERKRILSKTSCLDNNMTAYILDDDVTDHLFIYYVLLNTSLGELVSTTALPSLTRTVLSAIQLPLPSVSEQSAIATVLSDMDAEIAALERRREKARAIKQGMMQQLLTGRVRLVESAPAVKAKVATKKSKSHRWAFNEAVVISTLASHFGTERFPLGRKRYTKLSYLLHRHADRQTEGYLKKAAGPYNPKTRYGGPERIALENGYIREHKNGPYVGFVIADNIAQAEGYFANWYGLEVIQWLEQFRFKKNDELEVLATVDMAAEELRIAGRNVDVASVKAVIRNNPEWKAKLDRPLFSDARIAEAIEMSVKLFVSEDGGPRG